MTDPRFSNQQLSKEHLPTVNDITYHKLDPAFLKIELIIIGIIWIVAFSGAFTGLYIGDPPYPWIRYAVGGLILSICIISIVYNIKSFYRKGYALRELDIIYKEGIFWKKELIVPFNRIQHAEVNQGPIERMYGLGELNIYTAGGSSSDLSIKGITKDQAMSIKHYLLNKTALDEEE